MSPTGQQDVGRPARRPRVSWLVVATLLGASGPGCDCHPPRSKPWRHSREPKIEAGDPAQRSELAAVEARRADALRRREHTLRILIDAEPRHLEPLAAPSLKLLITSPS